MKKLGELKREAQAAVEKANSTLKMISGGVKETAKGRLDIAKSQVTKEANE